MTLQEFYDRLGVLIDEGKGEMPLYFQETDDYVMAPELNKREELTLGGEWSTHPRYLVIYLDEVSL